MSGFSFRVCDAQTQPKLDNVHNICHSRVYMIMYYIDSCNKYIKYLYYQYIIVIDCIFDVHHVIGVFLDTPLDDCGVYST